MLCFKAVDSYNDEREERFSVAKNTRDRRGWTRYLYLYLVLVLLLNVGAARADGASTVDPVNQPENFSAVLYDNTNGLPTSEANAIVQTSEGFIWIGSYGGLIRYDGNTFVRMDSTSGITSIKCLFVDAQDRLWIGTNDNGVAMLERGELRKWGKLDGMKSAHTRAITGDQNGTIYVATTCGIATIDSDGNLRMMEDEAIAEANMRDLRMGSDGIIYGLTNFGDLMKIKDGGLISFLSAEESPVKGVASMLPDPAEPGKLWFEGADYGFYHAAYGEDLTDLEPIDIQPLSSVQSMEYIDGKVWICSSYGIGVLTDDGIHVLEDLPMNSSVGHVMRDYLGNLWFTSTRQGVMKVVPNQFTNLFERYGLSTRVVNSTCMCEDKLFVATDTGLIVIDENGPLSNLPLTKAVTNTGADFEADVEANDLIALLDGCRIRSIIRDSQDRLWIFVFLTYKASADKPYNSVVIHLVPVSCFPDGCDLCAGIDYADYLSDFGSIAADIGILSDHDRETVLISGNGSCRCRLFSRSFSRRRCRCFHSRFNIGCCNVFVRCRVYTCLGNVLFIDISGILISAFRIDS